MLKSRPFLTVCILLICVIPLSYLLSAATGARRNINTLSQSTSPALKVVSTERAGDWVKVRLKNVSNKSITAFQIGVGGGRVQIEFLDADDPTQQELAPNQIYEEWEKLNPTSADAEVVVLAVVFDGGGSEGDGRFIKEIKDVRAGKKIQLARVLPLLRKAETVKGMDAVASLDDLEAQINSLTDVQDDNLSGSVKLGLQNGKEFILNKIRALKHTGQSRGLPDSAIVIGNLRGGVEKHLAKLAVN